MPLHYLPISGGDPSLAALRMAANPPPAPAASHPAGRSRPLRQRVGALLSGSICPTIGEVVAGNSLQDHREILRVEGRPSWVASNKRRSP